RAANRRAAHGGRVLGAIETEPAADAEVGHRGRVHVIVEAAAQLDIGVVGAVVGEADEATEVELPGVVVHRPTAEAGELELRADTYRVRRAAGLGSRRERGDRNPNNKQAGL